MNSNHTKDSLSLALREKLKQNSDFVVIDEKPFNKQHIHERVLAYCQWLDALDVRVVMLMSEPGIESLCLIYALIISNRVYIPIHSSTPPQAIKKYLDMTQTELLLVHPDLAKNWDTLHLCSDNSVVFDYIKINPYKTMDILPGMLLFTSGTTALSKAVHYHYDVIYKYLCWSLETFHFSDKDSYLFTTKLPFIASLRPLFLPFFSDMTLIIPKAQAHNTITEYKEKILQYRCSILSTTPMLFKKLLREIKQQKKLEPYQCIRFIFLSGEAIDADDINEWFHSINPQVQFFNLYGATEYLVPFYHHIKMPLTKEEELFLGELRTHSEFRLVPETNDYFRLLISGGLATAYLNPELNREFFLNEADKRFFKSNDLVQERKGKLYFIGRSQDLIKRHGHLIHLKQIESFIHEHFPHYRSAAMFDKDQNTITLFIEYPDDQSLFIEELKSLFKSLFPAYMHPDRYILLKHLPKTDSGKINYQALKDEWNKNEDSNLFSFFKKFFPNGIVDLNCRLVDIGMESIDYIEMGEKIYQATGKWLPSTLLTEECTIGQIPEKLCEPIIDENTDTEKVILNEIQEMSFLKQIKTEKSNHQSRRYFISYFCLSRDINIAQLEFAINQLINNHFMLCCHLEEINGTYYFVRSPKPTHFHLPQKWFRTSRIDKRLITSVHSERLVNFYIQKRGMHYYLIMAYHHIALDGWSALQLREELFLRYQDNEQVSANQLSLTEEIYYLNRFNQLQITKEVNVDELLTLAQNIEHKQEYNPLNHLFNSKLVDKNSFFVLSKTELNNFIIRYQLNTLPNSTILLLIFYLTMSEFSGFKKLMFFSSMSNRYLPGVKQKELMTNIAFSLPLFINGEHNEEINKLALAIKKSLDVNFRHMSYEAFIKIWDYDVAQKHYVHRGEVPYWLQYSYINYRNNQECVQNKYIDWEKSSSFVSLEEKGMIFLRVYDLADRFIINIDSKMNKNLHAAITNQFLKIIQES